jgi:hypothetical protein
MAQRTKAGRQQGAPTGGHHRQAAERNAIRALAPPWLSGLRAPFENVLNFYLGSEKTPVAFGGRQAELEELDDWLERGPEPYLVLAAEAGRGKTALLLRWAAHVAARGKVGVIFIPVSVRFGTNLPDFVFGSLATGLAAHHGEPRAPLGCLPPQLLQEASLGYMRRVSQNRPLLVILDGLDEAVGWEAHPKLFPSDPPQGLRVVVSARAGTRMPDAAAWALRLGWDGSLARRRQLSPLSAEGVAEVLLQMGFPPARVDLPAELYRLSEGEPLLLGLYAGELWQQGNEAPRLRPQDLGTIRPGYEGYIRHWCEGRQGLWGQEWSRREPQLQALLEVLSCACGPLARGDLLELLEGDGIGASDLDALLQRLGPLVSSSDCVFHHPRLAAYFYDNLPDRQRRRSHERFAEWGRRVLAELESGRRRPEEVSPYLARYLGEHLERAGAPSAEIYNLLSPLWLEVTAQASGAPRLFLNDAERVWRSAMRQGPPAAGHLVRAALYLSTFASMAWVEVNVPAGLLAACVRRGIVSPEFGLLLAWRQTPPEKRAGALAALAPHPPEPQRAEALAEALATARAIEDANRRAKALATARAIEDANRRAKAFAALVPHLPPHLLAEALAAARAIGDPVRRAEALEALAPHLPPQLLVEALAAARAIEHAYWRAKALAALAQHLVEPERSQVLAEALAAARAIEGAYSRDEAFILDVALRADFEAALDRAEALLALAPKLPEPERRKVVGEALTNMLGSLDEAPDDRDRVQVLETLAENLRKWRCDEVLGKALRPARKIKKALTAARKIKKPYFRAKVLTALAPHYPEPHRRNVVAEALATARQVANPYFRARALATLAPQLLQPWLDEALAAARAIEWGRFRAQALAALAPQLEEPRRSLVLSEGLAAAREAFTAEGRSEALAALASQLPESLLPEALAIARGILDEGYRGEDLFETLAIFAGRLPEPRRSEVLADALAAARTIGDENKRAKVLAALAAHHAEPERTRALAEALAAARAISDSPSRARALEVLAPHLPPHLLAEALAAARTIGDENKRAKALAALAPHLPPHLLTEALAAARVIEDVSERAEALANLAPHLPPHLLAEALAAACAIKDAHWRAKALADLAPHLPPHLLAEALAAARAIKEHSCRPEALAALAPHVPEPRRSEVLADALKDIGECFTWGSRFPKSNVPRAALGVLEILAPHLPEALLAEALATACNRLTGRQERLRASALAILAPQLSHPLLTEALAAARVIEHVDDRAEALAALAPHLPPHLLTEALAAARAIKEHRYRAEALSALAPRLAEPERSQVLAEALVAARAVEDADGRARVLAALAPHLPPHLLAEALAAARAIEHAYPRAEALAALAPHLAEPERSQVLAEALAAARAIEDDYWRAKVLAALAPHLPPHLLAEALVAACAIEISFRLGEAFAALAPHLPPHLLAEALAAARAIGDPVRRAEALEALAPHLPPQLLVEALAAGLPPRPAADTEEADPILTAYAEAELIARLGERLSHLASQMPVADLYQLFANFLHVLSARRRSTLLTAVAKLAPVILHFGGSAAVEQSAQAILDTAEWRPWIVNRRTSPAAGCAPADEA